MLSLFFKICHGCTVSLSYFESGFRLYRAILYGLRLTGNCAGKIGSCFNTQIEMAAIKALEAMDYGTDDCL